MARATGAAPTFIARPGRRVAVSMGVTVPEPSLATYTVRPSGVTATAAGERMIMPSSLARKSSPARIPQPSISEQSSGEIQAKSGVVAALARSAGSDSSGTT
jgi:hypothetical protein